jgi:hypothetical protein
VLHQPLGANLAAYAGNPGADSIRYEPLVAAARRILAEETPSRVAPDETSARLEELADAALASADAAGLAAGPATAAAVREIRVHAQLARFHARRALAAVHYNLFKRGLRLAELVAATYAEKDAVAAWRELTHAAGDHPLAPRWQSELRRLEAGLRELEDQCCPPDEKLMMEKVWEPRPGAPANRR